MKFKSIIALALGFALAAEVLKADLPNSSLPQGDQHVSAIAQQVSDVESAMILFKRCINQNRSNAETVNAFNIVADNYDRLCAHFAQFYYCLKFPTKTSGSTLEF